MLDILVRANNRVNREFEELYPVLRFIIAYALLFPLWLGFGALHGMNLALALVPAIVFFGSRLAFFLTTILRK